MIARLATADQVKSRILEVLIQWRRKLLQWLDFLLHWREIPGKAVSRAAHPLLTTTSASR
jgi:hypothetical protein